MLLDRSTDDQGLKSQTSLIAVPLEPGESSRTSANKFRDHVLGGTVR